MDTDDHVLTNEGDAVWYNVNLATMAGGEAYGAVENGAIVLRDEKIIWIG